MPQKRGLSASGSASLSVVIDRPEVLEATMACGATKGAIFWYRSRFQSMRSAMASMMRSQSRNCSMCSS
jgi:hypothetical protein